MIDTHSHIYLKQFDADLPEVIFRAKSAGVKGIVMPNVDISTIDCLHKVEAQYEGYCFAAMGLHPTSVKKDYQKSLEIIKKQFEQRSYVAVGEIGIDLYWDNTFIEQQKDAFRQQIEWAIDYDLPIIIHAREAFDEIFSIVKDYSSKNLRGIFHSFGGNAAQVQQIIDFKNFKIGINGIITMKNSDLSSVISRYSLDNFVLETDAPYLAPTPFRGKRNEPSYLSYVVAKMASAFGCSEEYLIKKTTENCKFLLSGKNVNQNVNY